MLYTLLGRIVWAFGKRRLKSQSRRRGGRLLLAVLAAGAGAGALVTRRSQTPSA
jgi:hypothetical protein